MEKSIVDLRVKLVITQNCSTLTKVERNGFLLQNMLCVNWDQWLRSLEAIANDRFLLQMLTRALMIMFYFTLANINWSGFFHL